VTPGDMSGIKGVADENTRNRLQNDSVFTRSNALLLQRISPMMRFKAETPLPLHRENRVDANLVGPSFSRLSAVALST
jgi:hypothetical protein